MIRFQPAFPQQFLQIAELFQAERRGFEHAAGVDGGRMPQAAVVLEAHGAFASVPQAQSIVNGLPVS